MNDELPVGGGVHDVDIMTPREVARLFRVSPKTVHRWAQSGHLPAFKTVGGHYRFYRHDVEQRFHAGLTGPSS